MNTLNEAMLVDISGGGKAACARNGALAAAGLFGGPVGWVISAASVWHAYEIGCFDS